MNQKKSRRSLVISLLKILVACVFIYSGWEKLLTPRANFVAIIDQYQFFSAQAIEVISFLVPWLELVFGTFLLLGFITRMSALVISGFLVSFIFLLGRSLMMGFDIAECGCFGSSITLAPWQAIVLDCVLLGFASMVAWRPPRLWSLDAWLQG